MSPTGVQPDRNQDKDQQRKHDKYRDPENDPTDRFAVDGQSPTTLPRAWNWDPKSRQYYYYDPQTDSIVFQNGVRMRCPAHIPRTSFTPAGSEARAIPLDYSSAGQNYIASPVTSPLPSFQSSQAPSGQRSVNSLTRAFQSANVQPNPYAYAPSVSSPGSTSVHKSTTRENGRTVTSIEDRMSQVKIVFAEGPGITDPGLLRSGIRAKMQLLESGNTAQEALFRNYVLKPTEFFVAGRVFFVLWVDSSTESDVTADYSERSGSGSSGRNVMSKIRLFVVVRNNESYCTAMRIVSYGARGVAKQGVVKSDHSIVYTGKQPPRALPTEAPERGVLGMRPVAIRVVADDPSDRLESTMRLDYGTIYTIQHNVNVKPFGQVHDSSMKALLAQFSAVWKTKTDGLSIASPPDASSGEEEPTRRRDSAHARSSGGGKGYAAHGEPSASSQRPGEGISERNGSQGQAQAQARAYIKHLVSQGYTQEQAMRAAVARQRQQQAEQSGKGPRNDNSDDEEDDEESEHDEDDDDDDDDDE